MADDPDQGLLKLLFAGWCPGRHSRRTFPGRFAGTGWNAQVIADLSQCFEVTHHVRGHLGQVGHLLFQGRKNLDPFDRVDAQIGFDVHILTQHLHRISGQLADDVEQLFFNALFC